MVPIRIRWSSGATTIRVGSSKGRTKLLTFWGPCEAEYNSFKWLKLFTFYIKHGIDSRWSLCVFGQTRVLSCVTPLHIVDLQWPVFMNSKPGSMNRFRGVIFAPGEHAKVVRGEKNKYKYRWPTLTALWQQWSDKSRTSELSDRATSAWFEEIAGRGYWNSQYTEGVHASTSWDLLPSAGEKSYTYQVIVEGGELKTLQCIVTPFLSTTEYSSPSLVKIMGCRSAKTSRRLSS